MDKIYIKEYKHLDELIEDKIQIKEIINTDKYIEKNAKITFGFKLAHTINKNIKRKDYPKDMDKHIKKHMRFELIEYIIGVSEVEFGHLLDYLKIHELNRDKYINNIINKITKYYERTIK